MALKSKSPERKMLSKPSKSTIRAFVRTHAVKCGWTSKMVNGAIELKVGPKTYPVTLADKYVTLNDARKKMVAPVIEGRFRLPKIDRKSFIQQEEAYDGEKTDIVYTYKVPKIAQEWIDKNQKDSYIEYIRSIYGDVFAGQYLDAEQKALEYTFGKRGASCYNSNFDYEGNIEYRYEQVWNEWHPNADHIMN